MLRDLRSVLEADEKRFLVQHLDCANELAGADIIVFGDGGIHLINVGADLLHALVEFTGGGLFQLHLGV